MDIQFRIKKSGLIVTLLFLLMLQFTMALSVEAPNIKVYYYADDCEPNQYMSWVQDRLCVCRVMPSGNETACLQYVPVADQVAVKSLVQKIIPTVNITSGNYGHVFPASIGTGWFCQTPLEVFNEGGWTGITCKPNFPNPLVGPGIEILFSFLIICVVIVLVIAIFLTKSRSHTRSKK